MPLISDLVFRGLGFPQINLSVAQGDKRSIRGETAKAYRYPLRTLKLNVAPLALARMVPDKPGHPTIPALERCYDFVSSFKGPAAIVWGDRDPVLGSVRSHVERTLPKPASRARKPAIFCRRKFQTRLLQQCGRSPDSRLDDPIKRGFAFNAFELKGTDFAVPLTHQLCGGFRHEYLAGF